MTRHNHNILFHLLHMGKIYQIAVVAPAEWSVFQFLFNALQGIIDMEGAFCIRIPLIIVPNPATSSPPTRISRKSAIQAHCLHAK